MEKKVLLITYVPPQPSPISAFDPDLDNGRDQCPDMEDLKTLKGADKIDLLSELLKKTPKEDLAKLLIAFVGKTKRTHKGTPHPGPITQHKVITVHSFCRNCDYSHVYTTTLQEGQRKNYIRKNNSVGSVECKKNFEPITVQSWGHSCHMCRVRMEAWPREKLEERYMQLLCRLSLEPLPSTIQW